MDLRRLRLAMHDFCEQAAEQLSADTHGGHEVPFEVVESGRKGAPLYCYRPLTADFIRERSGALGRLPGYLPAAHALVAAGRLDAYLELQGIAGGAAGRDRADAALHCLLARVFEDSSDFAFEEQRFDRAFREYETVVGDGRTETVAVAVVHGLVLESPSVEIGDGLSLVQGEHCDEAPDEARWARGSGSPQTLVLLRWEPAAGDTSPLAHALVRLRRTLLGLRLYGGAAVALAPLAWTRNDNAPWRPLALGSSAPAGEPTFVGTEQEDELRAFLSLIARRTPRSGEVAWALRRYELACERPVAAEALSDLLLALRALLEPEGPGSARLAGRLAALCAEPHDRARLTERVAHTVSIERAIVAGLAVDPALEALSRELAGHARALLRDLLCGHLDSDLVRLADSIIEQDAPVAAPAPPEATRPGGPATHAPAPAPEPREHDTFF